MGSIVTATNNALTSPLPELSEDSPTGYEGGLRRVILPPMGSDGYQWIMHTQELLQQGGWRIRYTYQDNAPVGREMHWSHSFIWWLLLTGKFHSVITGWPLAASVEAVAPYANTILLGLFLLASPWPIYRRLGAAPACAYVVSLVVVRLFYEFFMVGYPDHHGIVNVACFWSALFLALGGGGWVALSGSSRAFPAASTRQRAKRYFMSSGIAGGTALWVSAATVLPLFVGLGLAGCASLLLVPRRRSEEDDLVEFHPDLWRIWGLSGALTSLGFYALEYFPSHMGMRLEVNHPLYALALMAAGEMLARMGRWRAFGVRPWQGRSGFLVVPICLAGLLALPLLIKLDPERFFVVSDPFLWKLHSEHILEFKSLIDRLAGQGPAAALSVVSVILLVGVFILDFLRRREVNRVWKTSLLLLFLPGLIFTALGFWQVRWLGIAYGVWIAALPVWLAGALALSRKRPFPVWQRAVLALFFLGLLVQFPRLVLATFVETGGKSEMIAPSEAYQMAVRELAYHMKRHHQGDGDVTVLSGPTTTNWMMYYGGMKGLGTLYWENLSGLKAAAGIYAAPTAATALEQIKAKSVTDIALFSIDAFSSEYAELWRNLPEGSKPQNTFSEAVLNGKLPNWLTPLNFRMPRHFSKEWIALAEVHPDQSEADAHLARARWEGSRGKFAAAIEQFRQTVEADPGAKDAHLELAALLFLSDDAAEGRRHLDLGLAEATPEKTAEACYTIATYLKDAGFPALAVELLRRSVEAQPAVPSSRNLLAWILATSTDASVRKPEEALLLAATNLGFIGHSVFYSTLGAAQANNQQFEDAESSAQMAIDAARKAGEPPETIALYDSRLQSFRDRKPVRE